METTFLWFCDVMVKSDSFLCVFNTGEVIDVCQHAIITYSMSELDV